MEAKGVNTWQQGVFGCFNNIGLCLVTFIAPCYTFGKNAEALGEDCLMCGCLMCCIPELAFGAQMVLRYRLRQMRNIEGSLTSDLVMTALCGCCTLCQEAQEIRVMQGQAMAGDVDEKIERH